MAVKPNRTSFECAKELVTQGKVVVDERDAWSEDQPSTQEENEFIDAHGYAEYAKWHLGIDDEQDESIGPVLTIAWSSAIPTRMWPGPCCV